MIPYCVLLAAVAALLGLGRMTARHQGNLNWATYFDVLAIAVLAAFSGLRADVGADNQAYLLVYSTRIVPGYWWESWAVSGQDIGYAALEFAFRNAGVPYQGLVLAVSTVTVGLSCIGLWLASLAPRATILLYVTLATYLFPMNGQRQGLAVAIMLAGFGLWRHTGKRGWLILPVLAVPVHYSAAIAAVGFTGLWMITRARGWVRVLVALVVVGVPILLSTAGVVTEFASEVNPRYAAYLGEQGAGLGTIMSIVARLGVVVMAAVVLAARTSEPEVFVEIAAVLTGGVFVILGLGSLALARIDLYYWPVAAVLIPRVVMAFRSSSALAAGIGLSSLAYYLAYLSSWGRLIPYQNILDPLFLNLVAR